MPRAPSPRGIRPAPEGRTVGSAGLRFRTIAGCAPFRSPSSPAHATRSRLVDLPEPDAVHAPAGRKAWWSTSTPPACRSRRSCRRAASTSSSRRCRSCRAARSPAWCAARRRARASSPGDRVAAFCLLGGFAEVAVAPAVPDLPAARRARLRAGRGADPQLPHRVLLADDCAGGCSRGRDRARPRRGRRRRHGVDAGRQGPRRARRSPSCPRDEKEQRRARGRRRRGRALRRAVEGRGQGAAPAAASTSSSTRSAATASPTACARCARAAALVVVGFTGGSIPEVKVNRLLLNNIEVVGAGWGAYAMAKPEYSREIGAELDRLIDSGHVRPARRRALPARRRRRGAEADRAARGHGKVVLTPRSRGRLILQRRASRATPRRCTSSRLQNAKRTSAAAGVRVGVERARRDRDDAARCGSSRQNAARRPRPAPHVGVDEVRALRCEQRRSPPPRSPAHSRSRLAAQRRRERVARARAAPSAAAAACWSGVPPANVRYCLTPRTAATSSARPARPADLPAGERERLAEREIVSVRSAIPGQRRERDVLAVVDQVLVDLVGDARSRSCSTQTAASASSSPRVEAPGRSGCAAS